MTVTHTISKTRAKVGETVTLSSSGFTEIINQTIWLINYTSSDSQYTFSQLMNSERCFAYELEPITITITPSHLGIKTLTPLTLECSTVNQIGLAQSRPIKNNQYVTIGETIDVSFYISLAESIYSLGEKLATNINEKGVSASADDGLTTLANKIDDIYGNIPRVIIEDDTITDFADLRFTFIVPKNCTNIVNYCFYGFNNLRYCILPEGITRIGDFAFSNCNNLQQLEIPSTVTTLGKSSIEHLGSLRTLRFKSAIPPTVQNQYNFEGIPRGCTIEVPQESLSAYLSAQYYPDPITYSYVGY